MPAPFKTERRLNHLRDLLALLAALTPDFFATFLAVVFLAALFLGAGSFLIASAGAFFAVFFVAGFFVMFLAGLLFRTFAAVVAAASTAVLIALATSEAAARPIPTANPALSMIVFSAIFFVASMMVIECRYEL
jgi:hypothetical protein